MDRSPSSEYQSNYIPTISIVPADSIVCSVGDTFTLTISHGGAVSNLNNLAFYSDHPGIVEYSISGSGRFTAKLNIKAVGAGFCNFSVYCGDVKSNSINISVNPYSATVIPEETEEIPPMVVYTFVLDKYTKTIHRSECSHSPFYGEETTLFYEWLDEGYKKCKYCFSTSNPNTTDNSTSYSSGTTNTVDTYLPEPSAPPLPDGAYPPGQYKVGVDIPAGKYIVFPWGMDSGYFSVSSDANGDDIIFNDGFNGNSIFEIMYGDYLELSHCYAVAYSASVLIPNANSGDAFLVVGVHVSTGEHKIMATDDSGYYCIYNDLRQEDIVSNDNFENSRYITLSLGQYLYLSNAKLID